MSVLSSKIWEPSTATSEQPSGHLRWMRDPATITGKTLQNLWYITVYRGLEVEQKEEWRDVPFVTE